jgi:hypothetical protein
VEALSERLPEFDPDAERAALVAERSAIERALREAGAEGRALTSAILAARLATIERIERLAGDGTAMGEARSDSAARAQATAAEGGQNRAEAGQIEGRKP